MKDGKIPNPNTINPIIGKFCQIAQGVEFVMNGANHQMNAVSTFPFYTFTNIK